jgi:hypothetical protein
METFTSKYHVYSDGWIRTDENNIPPIGKKIIICDGRNMFFSYFDGDKLLINGKTSILDNWPYWRFAPTIPLRNLSMTED